VAGREIAVKKYVVKLSAEERERLEALVRSGKSPAQFLTRARILLEADVSEAGDGWSDGAISAALDTSINNVARTRQQWAGAWPLGVDTEAASFQSSPARDNTTKDRLSSSRMAPPVSTLIRAQP